LLCRCSTPCSGGCLQGMRKSSGTKLSRKRLGGELCVLLSISRYSAFSVLRRWQQAATTRPETSWPQTTAASTRTRKAGRHLPALLCLKTQPIMAS
jgi:hypothetical protein